MLKRVLWLSPPADDIETPIMPGWEVVQPEAPRVWLSDLENFVSIEMVLVSPALLTDACPLEFKESLFGLLDANMEVFLYIDTGYFMSLFFAEDGRELRVSARAHTTQEMTNHE
jgi:hypothetical protein